MNYVLNVQIDPAAHTIHVTGQIQNPSDRMFYLNENFHLMGAWAKGREISWQMDKSQPHPAFDTVSRPVLFETTEDEIAFAYEGTMPEPIAGVNQIQPDTIELSYYSGWYPKPANLGDAFDFEAEITMPAGYEWVSNGKITGNKIFSAEKQTDIVLFASTQVVRYVHEAQKVRCTFLCPAPLLPQMERRARELALANALFAEKYGSQDTQDGMTEIVSVYRPSGGWGYKRGDVTFLPAEPDMRAGQYKDDFHELAHSWWHIANVGTDDWINEAGAEFSAYTAAAAIYGDSFTQPYLADCKAQIGSAKAKISIAATDSRSLDRHINHYTKTTVMLLQAQKQFGADRVFSLLRQVYQTYRKTQKATTEGFLALCEEDMRSFFQTYLFAEGWSKLNCTVL